MGIGRRETVFRVLDRLVIRFATRRFAGLGPSIAYQPLPWAGLNEGRRATGTKSRMRDILKYLESKSIAPTVTLDIGANIGYFSLNFAERGAIAYAVEAEPLNVRIANIASNLISQESGSFVPIRLFCNADNVHLLPSSNVTLCLSIWHHWVRHLGLDAATTILNKLMTKTSDVMFFDTGESEMPDYYGLPFGDQDAKTWLLEYLGKLDNAGGVDCLGTYEAFMPGSDENQDNVKRHLFAIVSADSK